MAGYYFSVINQQYFTTGNLPEWSISEFISIEEILDLILKPLKAIKNKTNNSYFWQEASLSSYFTYYLIYLENGKVIKFSENDIYHFNNELKKLRKFAANKQITPDVHLIIDRIRFFLYSRVRKTQNA